MCGDDLVYGVVMSKIYIARIFFSHVLHISNDKLLQDSFKLQFNSILYSLHLETFYITFNTFTNSATGPTAYGNWDRLKHLIKQYNIRHSTINTITILSLPKTILGAGKVKRQRRGDKRHRHDASLQKSGGRKNLPPPATFGGHGTSFSYFFLA